MNYDAHDDIDGIDNDGDNVDYKNGDNHAYDDNSDSGNHGDKHCVILKRPSCVTLKLINMMESVLLATNVRQTLLRMLA